MNSSDPHFDSRGGPKKNNTSMFPNRCMKSPCKNMYVTAPQGRKKNSEGWKENQLKMNSRPTTIVTRNATVLAISSFFTHGVS